MDQVKGDEVAATLELEGASVALVGSFNPRIFQPAWFGVNKLLPMTEVENADISVVHKEVVIFSVGDWLRFEVTPERWTATTLSASHYPALRDFAVGTFEILEHTPIAAFGMNLHAHYAMPEEAEWHALGDLLAPKEPWAGLLTGPGLRSLAMQGERTDRYRGHVKVTIEPSQRVPTGVFLSVNNHVERPDSDDTIERADWVVHALGELWGGHVEWCYAVQAQLLGMLKRDALGNTGSG